MQNTCAVKLPANIINNLVSEVYTVYAIFASNKFRSNRLNLIFKGDFICRWVHEFSNVYINISSFEMKKKLLACLSVKIILFCSQ